MVCRSCRKAEVDILLDAGLQPLSNRYVRQRGEAEDLRPMVVGQCPACALFQLVNPATADDARPRFSWITYREPESHLDGMVEELVARPEVPGGCRVLGLSFKDESVLQRLERRGFAPTLLSMEADLGIAFEGAGLESVQQALTPQKAKELADRLGRFPLVIARHIFEHAHDTSAFLEAVKLLATPDGVIVFEVPDSTRALGAPDYTVLWEEHILMLTPASYRRAVCGGGLAELWFQEYAYPNENSMVLFTRNGAGAPPAAPAAELEPEFALGRGFGAQFAATREQARAFFDRAEAAGQRVAMFGAGHNACVFLNLYGLGDRVAFVADDHPGKVGLLMPGCQTPIRKSADLLEEGVALCLSSLSPESENTVLAKNQAFASGRVEYLSIYPASQRYFLR